MALETTGSTVPRRQLGRYLRELRNRERLTVKAAAESLEWSEAKIWRIETGQTSLRSLDVQAMCRIYGAPADLTDALMGLARETKARGWWHAYGDVIPEGFDVYIGLEEAASQLAWYESELVPGLLQTEDYARQVFLGYQTVIPIAPGVVEQRVKLRMRRQERLTSEPPVRLSVVLDESVLLRRLGDNEMMRSQLQHLADVGARPNVDLRVLPLDNNRVVMANSFTLLRFDDAMLHDVVNTESIRSELYVEGEDDTYSFRLFFESLVASALPPAESQEVIRRIAERLWT